MSSWHTQPTQSWPPQQPAPRPPKRRSRAVLVLAILVGVVLAGVVAGTLVSTHAIEPGHASTTEAAPVTMPDYLKEESDEDAATTTTTTPPPTTPAFPAFEPVTAQGVGDTVVTVPPHSSALVVQATCDSCSGNFIVKGVDGGQQLLVNVIGHYVGQVLLDLYDHEHTTQLQVLADDGAWSLTFSGLDSVKPFAPGETMATTGDAIFYYTGADGIGTMAYSGDGNFIVQAVNLDSGNVDLLVNAIGAYNGTIATPGPSVLLITADGDWSIVVT